MYPNPRRHLLAATVAGLATFFTGLGLAFACSPAPGYLDTIHPSENFETIPPDTAFTVSYHGVTDRGDRPGLPVTVEVTGPSGEVSTLPGERVASQGLVGAYLRFEPESPLPEGEIELRATLDAAGDSGRPTEMTRTYTVDPDETRGDPLGFEDVSGSTVNLDGPADSCSGTTMARVRATLDDPLSSRALPAYAVVTFSANGGDATRSYAIPGDQLSADVEKTFDVAYKAECVGIHTVWHTGETSTVTDSCDVRDCGSQKKASDWQEGRWSAVCDDGGDDVGPDPTPDAGPDPTPDAGTDTGPRSNDTGTGAPDAASSETDAGLEWRQSQSGGCRQSAARDTPIDAIGWLALMALVGFGTRSRRGR